MYPLIPCTVKSVKAFGKVRSTGFLTLQTSQRTDSRTSQPYCAARRNFISANAIPPFFFVSSTVTTIVPRQAMGRLSQ